jgi:site-specific recombinase XerC
VGRARRPPTPPPRRCDRHPDRGKRLRRSLEEELTHREPNDPAALPKDNDPRALRITAQLSAALQARIKAPGIGPDELLFANQAGQPISRSTFRARTWLPAVKATGLDFHLRWHDLRHTNASWLLAGGADLKTVMDRLGHTQLSTTQQYLHTLPNTDDTALQAHARVRRGATGT